MPSLRQAGELSQVLARLPAVAAVLLATRMARRAALAMLEGQQRADALAACDALDASLTVPAATGRLPRTAVAEVLRHAKTAFRLAAAEAAGPAAAAAVLEGIAAICADRRVSVLQVEILLRADLDLLAFAASEAGRGSCSAAELMARLPPCHALDLQDPDPAPEERFR